MGRQDAETETLIPTTGAAFDEADDKQVDSRSALGFTSINYVNDMEIQKTPTLTTGGGGGYGVGMAVAFAQNPPVTFNWQNGGGYGNANEGLGIGIDEAGPQSASQVQAVAFTASEQLNSYAWERDVYPTLDAQVPNDTSNIQKEIRSDMAVRRLTPLECERLQGFPDKFTDIPGASDSARYKALGNSMAVPVMRWIGERIDAVHKGEDYD